VLHKRDIAVALQANKFHLCNAMREGTSPSVLAEDELVSRLFKQDREAFAYLYDNYAPALYGIIFRIVQKEEIARDVLQECFLKIWSNFTQYDKTKGRLFTWTVNIARNLAIDTTRSKDFKNQSKNLDISDLVNTIDSKQTAVLKPDQIGLRALIEKLKPEQRQLIDMVYFGGYTQAEVAETLNIPLGTVKTRIRAALLELRAVFK
jgi:RNA polymerase sigma-70 factor, ECF subfamily